MVFSIFFLGKKNIISSLIFTKFISQKSEKEPEKNLPLLDFNDVCRMCIVEPEKNAHTRRQHKKMPNH